MLQTMQTPLNGVLLIQPKVIGDERGFFMESWRQDDYAELGIPGPFVQDNVARSRRGVLRGLHYQHPHPQGKLVSVLQGEIHDVVVDLRLDSGTFGRWQAYRLSAENHLQLWIPPGFAHGYQVLSESAFVAYKCTDLYRADCEMTLLWNDPALAIDWPIAEATISAKDRRGTPLHDIDRSRLFGLSPHEVDACS